MRIREITLTLTLTDGFDAVVFTAEVSVFHYNSSEGDVYDELEDGQYYFSFDHDDLFVLNPLGCLLKKKNLMPEEKGWTNYG